MAKTITKTIRVTREDIRRGKSESSKSCPIAHATRRAFPGWNKRVFVNGGSIDIGQYTAELPVEGSDFVELFDDGCKVSPFSMTVTFER